MLNQIKQKVTTLIEEKPQVLLAIDGRCAAGKTTLAQKLAEIFSCPVIHMDDFFLRPEQRTKERLETPGGNVDHERFLEEVMTPLRERKGFSYRPFDCHSQQFKEPVRISQGTLIIVEGSYSCHPSLWDHYDLRIFLDVTEEEQRKRILKRNGEAAAKIFQEKWIPMEEKYFEQFHIREKCDIIKEYY